MIKRLNKDSNYDTDPVISKYKSYTYSTKDYKDIYQTFIPCAQIETAFRFEIKDGILYFKDLVIDITNMLIIDIFNLLQDDYDISVRYINGLDSLFYLPAVLLSNICNRDIKQLKGEYSPFNINSNLNLKEFEEVSKITIFDIENNNRINYLVVDNDIYYDTTATTKIIVNTQTNIFFLNLDLNLRHFRDGYSVGNLLKYSKGKDDVVLLPEVIPNE